MQNSRMDGRKKRRREETSDEDESSGEERETEQGRVRGNVGPSGSVGGGGADHGTVAVAVGGEDGAGENDVGAGGNVDLREKRRDDPAASSARYKESSEWTVFES